MKKNFLTSVAFALALGLVACGDDSGSNSEVNGEKGGVITLADGSGEKVCDEMLDGWVAEAVGKDFRRCQNGEWTKITASEASAEDEIIGGVTVLQSSSSETIPGSSSSVTLSSSSSVIPDPDRGSSSSSAKSSSSVASSSSVESSIKDGSEYDAVANTLTDLRDGQVYKTIEICDKENKNCQTWMAQNLNYAYTGVAFCTSDSTSWCYDDDPSNCATYGRLYTWAAAVDSVAIYKNYGEQCGYGKFCTRFRASALATAPVRGVCPSGWHLPSNAEWGALYTNVGGAGYAGQKLKANTSLWTSYSGVTNDDSFGFSVLPAGFRNNGGDFDNLGEGGGFWSSTEYENHSNNALNLYFNYNYDYAYQGSNYKRSAFSVRCLKDSF